MNKKYLPYIILIAAALLLFFIKKNQRGNGNLIPSTHVIIPAVNNQDFNRNISKIIYSKHARCRMNCRYIDETEVMEILRDGTLNINKIEEDSRGKTYPLEGVTHDHQKVRIVFAPKEDELVVVTVVDLDRDWPCDCR